MVRPVSVPEAKADPALRRFELRRLRVPLAGGFLNLVVPEARRVLRSAEVAEGTRMGREPPYWARIWPASVGLARFVRGQDCRTLRAVDLGCGLGVAGLAAGLAGASVTFADRDPDALAFAAWNASRSGAAWPAAIQILDWSCDRLRGQFDVMLLADVSYSRRHHAGLLDQISAGLAPDGVVLHADPGRPDSDVFLAALGRTLTVGMTSRSVKQDGIVSEVRLSVASANPAKLREWLGGLAADRPQSAEESAAP